LAGLTLVELVLATGILAAAIAASLAIMLSVVRLNRLTAVRVAALQAVNRTANGLESASRRLQSDQSGAYEVVRRYKDLIGSARNQIAVGPKGSYLARVEEDEKNGRLICRFTIPEPGESIWPEEDRRFRLSRRARVEMHIYLNEDRLNRQVLPPDPNEHVWTGLGKRPGPAGLGIDLNLNGRLDDNLLHDYETIKQLVVDITAIFYEDESHIREAHRFSRRLLLAGLDEENEKFDPTLP
jgi:type II secretory pathway component PulJ